VSNVTHGTFQTTSNGTTWNNATSFTTAQIAANQVRFVHDGGELAPTFSIRANDGSADSNTIAAAVTFTNVNDPPVNSVPGAQTIASETPRFFNAANGNAITISDTDVNQTLAPNNKAQVQLGVLHGTLTLGDLDGVVITGGANGSATVTIQGTIGAINGALASLMYQSAVNFSGSDTLTVTTSDLGHTGTGGA